MGPAVGCKFRKWRGQRWQQRLYSDASNRLAASADARMTAHYANPAVCTYKQHQPDRSKDDEKTENSKITERDYKNFLFGRCRPLESARRSPGTR